MARPRKRMELEDGVKLDVNKLRVQAISQGEPTQQVVCCYPRYSGDARRFGLLVWRFSSATRGSMRLLLRSLDQSIDLVAAPRHFGGVQWYFVCPICAARVGPVDAAGRKLFRVTTSVGPRGRLRIAVYNRALSRAFARPRHSPSAR